MLKLRDIRKSFGPVEVLKGISFELEKGVTLGLVGENGAGKSTLMNILGGVIEPTDGDLEFDGQPYIPIEVSDSLQQGIAFIHQELNLFPNLTIKENLFINNFPKKTGLMSYFIDQHDLDNKAKQLLAEVGLNKSPATKLSALTNGQQQLVEIAKALNGDPKLIILDEPSTALSKEEKDKLIDLISKLKLKGISMIYISHNLDEVKSIADRIAVLRDGTLIRVADSEAYPKAEIIRDMVGRDLAQFFPSRNCIPGVDKTLEVDRINVDGKNELSFEINEHEVLGIYGLVGAGRSELARGMFGLQKVYGGKVKWKGSWYSKFNPRRWIDKGLVYLTEDRREEGILAFKNIRENVQLASLSDFARKHIGWLNYSSIRTEVERKVTDTRVKYQHIENQPVIELSGGNQQKVLLSRWLMTKPEVLILDEPTKGIDIGAREEIYQLINQLVEQGAAVLLISSEIEELLGMCDRILVMNHGTFSAEFKKSEFDQSEILKKALTTSDTD